MTKVKIWQVKFQNKIYSADYDYVNVEAQNAKCAIQKAITKMKGRTSRRLQEIESVELRAET